MGRQIRVGGSPLESSGRGLGSPSRRPPTPGQRAFLAIRYEPYARTGLTLLLAFILMLMAYRPWGRFLHPLRFRSALCRDARINGLDPSLVAAVVLHESSYRPEARSAAGALGLMQLMPTTARWLSRRFEGSDVSMIALLDPEVNLRLGTLYLGELRSRFGNDPILYLAAFNAGPENVREWLAHNHSPHLSIEQIPFGETRRYVRSVLACQTCYRQLYSELQ